jgi:ubiquinone/menaquinone biosynthesis C-methylase UbiE
LGVSNATFRLSEATTLPYEDGSFDIIYSNGTFHHIDERLHAAVLAELARTLKPNGSLFVFENNPLNPLTVRAMRQNPFDRGTKMILPWTLQRRVARTGLKARTPRFYVFLPRQLKSLRWTERYLRAVPFGAQYYVRGSKGGS